MDKKEEHDPKKLINWSEPSRLLVRGDRNGIRTNKIPLKHQEKVGKLIESIEKWMEWAKV